MKQKNKRNHKKGFLGLTILLIVTLFALIMTASNQLKAEEMQTKELMTEISQQEETKESIEVSDHEKDENKTAESKAIKVEKEDIEKKGTKEIKPKITQPQKDSTIYFAEPLVAEILTGDAGVGFDDNDNPGYDSSAENDIIRSFDKIFYSFKINLDSQSKELYTDIVLKITGKVKNGVSDDGRMLNAAFSSANGGSYNLNTKTSVINMKIGGSPGSEGANTGSNRTITLPLEVFGAKHGTIITVDDFEVQILSARDSNGKIHDLTDEKIIEKVQSLKNTRVSSKVNLKPSLVGSYSYQYASFNEITKSSDDSNANIRQAGIAVAIVPLKNRGTSLLGSAGPTGKVKLKISQVMNKIDTENGNKVIKLDIGKDIRPLSVFDYGYVGGVNEVPLYPNNMNQPYLDYIRLPSQSVYVPRSKYTWQVNSVFDTGKINISNNTVDNTIQVEFDEYKIDMERMPIITSPENPPTSANPIGSIPSYEKFFLSAGMYLFEPKEVLTEGSNINYYLRVDEIVIEEEDESEVIVTPTPIPKGWSHSWTLQKYPKGTMDVFSKYLTPGGGSLGSSPNFAIGTGDSRATKSQKIRTDSIIHNKGNFSPVESDILQKWNPEEAEITSASQAGAPVVTGGGRTQLKDLEYGVSKSGNYDLVNLNNNRYNDYTWYLNLAEAKSNGEVSAVFGGSKGARVGNSYETVRVLKTVKNSSEGVKDEKGNPFVTISWGKFYNDEEKTNTLEYPLNSIFEPTEYIGDIITKPQAPMGRYGDTLNVVPYQVVIKKESFKYQTSQKESIFQSSDTTSWKLEPQIITSAKGEQPEVTVEIKDTLDKGMRYVDMSSKIGEENVEPEVSGPDAEGKTTLVWNLEASPGKGMFPITYDTTFVQSEMEFGSSGTSSLVNKVVISSPADSTIESLRSASKIVTVIKEQKWEIDKTVSKPNPDYQPGNGKPEWVPGDLVESDTSDVLKYTLKVTNQTGKDIVNASILDVLPKDGEIGSLFEGKVDLKTIKILGNNKQVNPAGEAYYTENPVPRDSNPNDIAEDLFSWEDYTGELNTGSSSTKVDANAVFALIPLLKDDESAYVEITVVFKGNQPGNIYKNIANGNSENYTGVIGSRNQVTRVINRLINGRVWLDRDHSGGIDPTEALKADVPVTLYSLNAAGVKTKVKTNIRGDVFIDDSGTVLKKTDSDGKYEFDALPAGDYVVGFDLGNQITTNELYITKYEALGIIDRNNNNVPESPMEVDGTNYLTAMAKKINLPKAVNTISDGEKKDINLGVLGKPKLAAIKKVLDSSGNDIHDKKVKVGDTIRYEIEMTNTQANSVVENVKLSDTIPEGLKFVLGTLTVSVDGAPGTPIDNDRFDETGRILTTIATDTVQDLGDIVGPTGKIIVGFDVTIEKNASGKLVNVAKVSGDVVDKPKPDEKTTNEVENNTPPLPTLVKAVNVEEAKLGDVLTYTLTVGNAKGGGEWQNVVVTDNLPVYLSYVANTTKIEDVAKPDAGVWSNGKMSLPLGKIQSEEAKKITFDAKVISVPTDYQVINKVNATGQDKDDKPYAPKEAEVETPMYYRLLHVRQVILNNDETELVIPSTGYYDVSNQATVISSTNSSNHALTSGSTTKDSGPEIAADLYTSRYIGLDKTVKGVLISDRIPEYYEYVGHIATTDKSKLAKEHLSTLLPADSQTKLAFVDYAMADEYWVTIYLQPKFGQDKNDEPEESPRPYSWSGRINNFGQLK